MSTVWNYQYYGDTLQLAADEAERQSHGLQLKTCKVRKEENNRSCIATNDEANAYNQKLLKYCKTIGGYIKKYLIGGLLTNDDSILQDHEKSLGVMLYRTRTKSSTKKSDVDLAWKAKISQMFIEGYNDGVFSVSLQTIYDSLCIKNQINPADKQPILLTGSEAYHQKLTISHIHHLQGANIIFDGNPNNFVFENFVTNMGRRSCSRFLWLRKCQCNRPCHHRCVLLDKKRYEHEVRIQLVMSAGFWPTLKESEIREEIRDAFIAHHERNNQAVPDYLSEDNRQQLISQCRYHHFENLRPRIDMNAEGAGIQCPRQGRVKFMEILRGEKDIPKGLLEFLSDKLNDLIPANVPRVQSFDKDAEYDRSIPGKQMTQDDAIQENLYQFQRVLATLETLKKLARGEFIFNHPEMSMQEGSVDAVLYCYALGSDQQSVHFHISTKGIRNGYYEDINKKSFSVNIARLLKSVQVYVDHHDSWLQLDNGGQNVGGAMYANPQIYLNHISISSPPTCELTPQEAYAQVLNASHMHHPDAVRHTEPTEPQEGGEPRDANPDNTWIEAEEINVGNRGICSSNPSIPSMNRCQCHPTYPCSPVLFKLDERYINETALVHSQLGDNGRYPQLDICAIRRKLVAEVRSSHEKQGVTVPAFILLLEANPDAVFPVYTCPNCQQQFRTLAEVSACRCGEQLQPASNQDVRVEMSYEDIKSSEEYKDQILSLIKEWGWGNWSMIWKKATFKISDKMYEYIRDTRNKYLRGACKSRQIRFEVLLKCSGIKFGCPCELHDEEDNDEEIN